MWFPAALISSTLVTIIGIFAVYKIFLDHPNYQTNPSPSPLSSENSTPQPTQPQQSPTPSLSIKPIASPTPLAKPSPSLKAIIGSVTLLKDNLSSAPTSNINGSSNISGQINLSGTIPSGTSLVIVARKTGTNDSFQTVVSGIAAVNDTTWTWGTANSGNTYDMIAILKGVSSGNNIDYAKSQIYVVPAPAYGQIFNVDAGFAMDPPTGSITTTCTNKNTSNNTWSASVNFLSITGAQAYWLQVGKSSGASDLSQIEQNAQSGTSQTINLTFTDSVIYYARYATASVPNPTSAQYSAFSTEQTIKCP